MFHLFSSEVLFLSGIEIGGSNTNEMALTMLSDYIRGGLGSAEEASKICRVFIAGNSITQEAHDKEQHYKVSGSSVTFYSLIDINYLMINIYYS